MDNGYYTPGMVGCMLGGDYNNVDQNKNMDD